MSIVKPVMPDDPFGAFAWRACLANLALQKVRDRILLDPEESKALRELSKDASDLATMMRQGVTALNECLLNLSYLVVGAQTPGYELDLDQLSEGLCRVVKQLPFYPAVPMDMDDALLGRMQGAINELIERANRLRPQPDRSPLIECVT